jgi:signal transduction histidine kinase
MSVRILLIDDSPFDRELATRALGRLPSPPGPVELVTAVDWEQARGHLEEEPLDLILLDFHLPKLTGLEILRRIESTPHPPVLMLTGQDDLSVAVETLRAGALDYVSKSGEWATALCLRVENVLARVQLEQKVEQYQRWLESYAVELEEKVQARTAVVQAQAKEIEQLYLKTEETARLKQDILANLSHELRTPLNAILGYADLLEEDLAGALTPAATQKLEVVQANGRKLLELVNTVLGIVRTREGQESITRSRFPVQGFLDELRAEAVVLQRSKSLELDWRGPAGHCEIVCDREKLRTIAYQLLSNAIKFTHTGRIVIRLEPGPQGGVELTVTDSGVGLPVELRETVFEDFRQADGSSTRRYGGLGLGLGIVKRYVALLDGTLSLTSQPHAGTTVVVALPGESPRTRPPSPPLKGS